MAAAVRSKQVSSMELTRQALERIGRLDPALNCFTGLMERDALRQASEVDRKIAAGEDPGQLAGVPFAVKNLFDVAGLTTLAGSKIEAENPPASRDAECVTRLKEAGAVLLGALNMDEYAYGFTTENSHYGPTRNPHDVTRVAGGSSGGSAAAVAAGMVPLTLGSDTNGSIRVPAAFCGVFGLKPTYGRISRAGAFLFVESFDHVGPFTRTVRDLACAFDVMNGPDENDPVCSKRPRAAVSGELSKGARGLRIALAGGYFQAAGTPEVHEAVNTVANALQVRDVEMVPQADAARAAAYVITACEGSSRHLGNLQTRPQDFDPVVVERLLAGALIPSAWYVHAQKFRRVFQSLMRSVFEKVDILLAPSTPCAAITIGQPTITVGGKILPSRPNIGVFAQPLSFVGLPIVSVPVVGPGKLPLGVQIIGAPYQEAAVLRVAAQLEEMGVCRASVPDLIEQTGVAAR